VKPVGGLRRTAFLFYNAPLPSREIRVPRPPSLLAAVNWHQPAPSLL